MRWEKDKSEYASGELLYLGRWKVGGCHYDLCQSKGNPNKWKATCNLPDIKQSLGHFFDEDGAKEAAEKMVKHWLAGLPSNA